MLFYSCYFLPSHMTMVILCGDADADAHIRLTKQTKNSTINPIYGFDIYEFIDKGKNP